MGADSGRILVGILDATKVGALLSLNVSRWTAGTFQYVGMYGFVANAMAVSIKRAIAYGVPQAFPTALNFTSTNVVRPGADGQDLSGTDAVVFTVDTAADAGFIEIWFIGKADN